MLYPVHIVPFDGGFVLTFTDIPEVRTEGSSKEETFIKAENALISAFNLYFIDRRKIPCPSKIETDFFQVSASVAAKVILLNEVILQNISNVELARRMNINRQEITRLFDFNHSTKIDTIQKALNALGRRLEIILL